MKTVRVRILVAVTDDGAWLAEGHPGRDKRWVRDVMDMAKAEYDLPINFHWIEAEVPVPEPCAPTTIIAKGTSRPKRRPG